MAKIKFINGRVEDYTIVLSTRDKRHLGQISGIKSVQSHGSLRNANEISFVVYKDALMHVDENNVLSDEMHHSIKNHKEDLWKNIINFKLIWIKELNEYYQIAVSTDDSLDVIKTVTATSLCEAELSQTMLYNFEINTEVDIERDDYEITKFYNKEKPEGSLLHRVLEKAPHYKIKHVDASLCNLQRTFSIDGSSIYDFLTGECSEQFDCLFTFDTTDRSISVYDLLTVCNDCGEREDYIDKCPKCGSTNLKYYGKDTTIYVDKNNLSESIHFEENSDGIKNCFKLEAGDETITATVRELNQNGTDYITYIPESQKADMPIELVELLENYDDLYNSHKERYEELLLQKYECIDELLKLEHSMMPTIEHAEVTAKTEADKLTEINLSPIALPSLTSNTSLQTVNSALKNYAKVYIKTGYVKLDVIDGAEFVYGGHDDETELNYGSWYGKFKVTNYSDEEDIVETDYLNIEVNDNYEEFVEQKILKKIKNYEDEENGSVFDVLAIDELDDFKEALTKYSMSRLVSFRDAIEGALDVLRELGQSTPPAIEDITEVNLYDTLYLPYYEKLKACDEAISTLQKEIDKVNEELENVQSELTQIQKELDFEKYLGGYYPIFCAYRREDKYSNSNYVSDGLTNAEVIDKAKEFIQIARKELVKSSNGEKSITAPLYNLLTMKEFQPLVDYFELGNWIRIRVDGQLYRMRLIGYTINFDDLQNIEVEFSTITKINDVTSDIQSILSSAQSMATNFGYVSKQAKKGQVANDTLNSVVQDGLNSGLIQIKNNPECELLITKNGLLGRSWDDITGTYSPKQIKIINNIIAFTADNWKTTSQVIGEHEYKVYNPEINDIETHVGYGVTAEFFTSEYITGKTIVGGQIYSSNYKKTEIGSDGTYIDLENGIIVGGLIQSSNYSNSEENPTGTLIDLINGEIIGGIIQSSNYSNEEGFEEGTYLNLLDGSLSLGGGGLTYTKEDGLKIDSTAIEDMLDSVDIISSTLGIKAENIDGKINASQIESVYSSVIDGKITSDKIDSIESSKITGTIESSQISSIISEKTLTDCSMTGNSVADNITIATLTYSSINTIQDDVTYTGITGNYVIGDYTMSIVNGIIVSMIENVITE